MTIQYDRLGTLSMTNLRCSWQVQVYLPIIASPARFACSQDFLNATQKVKSHKEAGHTQSVDHKSRLSYKVP